MSACVGALRWRIPAAAMLCVATAVVAVPLRGQEPDTAGAREHVVKPGDTLWDLSRLYLGDPFLWGRVYDANRQMVKHPHWIYPGQRLRIPGMPEQNAPAAEAAAGAEGRTIFYRPPETDELSDGAELRPAVERGEFLAAPWLGDARSLPVVGRMLDRVRVQTAADRLPQMAMVEDEVYIRATAAEPVGSELLAVQVGRSLPGYGNVIVPTALLRVERVSGAVLTARLARQYGAVMQGQAVLAVPAFTPPAAAPTQPVDRGVEGELIGFEQSQVLHTTADVGFVSLGRADGIAIGDELLVYAPARPDPTEPATQLPPEDVATLRVVKVTEHTATARVVSMRLPSLQSGLKARLVARVP